MLCVAGGLWLTALWLREDARPTRRDALAVGAGLLLGLSVTGRQPFLAALPAIALLARRGAVRPALLQLVASLLLPRALFLVLGSLVSADLRFTTQGYRWSNGMLMYAYACGCALLPAPRFFLSLRARWVAVIVAASIAATLVFDFYRHFPLGYFLDKYFPPAVVVAVARTWGGMLIALAALYIAAMLKNLWERREDRMIAFTGAATLLMALTPIKITHIW